MRIGTKVRNTKTCNRCQKTLPPTEFYKDSNKPDKLQSWCRQCIAAYHKVYQKTETGKVVNARKVRRYLSTPEGRAESSKAARRYRQSPAGKKYNKEYRQSEISKEAREKYCQKNPERIKSRSAVSHAIRDGKLVRPETCSKCGSPGFIEAHHEDYTKSLDVNWLCKECHIARHQELRDAA